MKIYVLTEGDYSDYHIITATTNKEKAELLQKRYNESISRHYHVNIEEFEDGDTNDTRLDYDIVAVPKLNDFKVIGFEHSAFLLTCPGSDAKFNKVKKISGYIQGHVNYCVTVKANNVDEAIKIGQDLINMHRAQEEGVC